MGKSLAGRCCQAIVATVLAATVWPATAFAGSDYSKQGFGFRLPPAFLRFTEVSTMGGATVANRMSSAINPGAADWSRLPVECGIVLAPYYSLVRFDEGLKLHVIGESLVWQSRRCGTFLPVVSQIRTNRTANRQGLTFDYRVDTCQITWAKRCGNRAFGATFNYAEAEVVHSTGGFRVSESHAESYRFRFGGLYEPAARWLTGLVFEYGFAPYRAQTFVPTEFGIITLRDRGTQHQMVLRPGVSYEYAEMSTVFLDYQVGAFFSSDGCHFNHRFSTGIEHRVLAWLFLRVGGSICTRGNVGWNCGAGAHLSRHCSFDFGYRYDVLPELRREFGRSHTLQFTFSVRF